MVMSIFRGRRSILQTELVSPDVLSTKATKPIFTKMIQLITATIILDNEMQRLVKRIQYYHNDAFFKEDDIKRVLNGVAQA